MSRGAFAASLTVLLLVLLAGCGGTGGVSGTTTTGGSSTGSTTTVGEGGAGGDTGGQGGHAGSGQGGLGGGGQRGLGGGGEGGSGLGGNGLGGSGQGGSGQGGSGQGGSGQGGSGQGGNGLGGSGQGGAPPEDVCLWCHGDANNPAPHAPPRDLGGHVQTSFPGVGAHQAHLAPADWHKLVTCTECHTVPSVFGDPAVPTHANGVDDVIWGPLAQQGNYDPATTTCTSTYCHGGPSSLPDLPGEVSNRAPVFIKVDGSQKKCGQACHTTPPGGNHPSSTNCTLCHGAVISTFTPGPTPQATWTDPSLHINGVVDLAGTFGCVTCHGDNNNVAPAAPPKDTFGNLATTFSGVGAHQAHLTPSDWHGPVACAECHDVPAEFGDPAVPTHDDGVRDLHFGPLAKQGSFDAAAATCSGTYCHGAMNKFPDFSGSVANRTPQWTKVDGTQDLCGSACHTTPPGNGHSTSTACQQCHGAVITGFTPGPTPTATWNDADLHVNGVIDVTPFTCVSCHGDAANVAPPAPPKDTQGHVGTVFPGVGAHQSHLTPSSWHGPVTCDECHQVPAAVGDPSVPTHQNGVDDLAWGALAKQGNFDPATLKCASTYCHGGMGKFGDGGGVVSNRTPTWTTVNGSQAACGKSCHTTPPGGGHTTLTSCPQCHGAVISSFTPGPNPTATWADASLHIDGQLQVIALGCTSCHGDPNNVAPEAPPQDTLGHLATTFPGVGAHQSHLAPSGWHGPIACAECHQVPASFGDPAVPTHMNGADDLFWGPLAQQGTFAAGTNTCADTYCHGGLPLFPDPPGKNVNRLPVWTAVDGSQEVCGSSCHATPPGGNHTVSTSCPLCHGGVIASFTQGPIPTATWANPSLHVNGEVNVFGLTCTTCHGDESRAANKPAPPLGTNGETLTSQPAVGAHQQHLTVGSTWHRDAQCSDCHLVPASTTHTNGAVELFWGPGQLASADGATPTIDFATVTCSGVYCHGNTLLGPNAGGVVQRSPVWTTVNGSYDACGSSCHTNPPGGSHPDFPECSICHTQVVSSYNPANLATTWSDRTLHVDGVVEHDTYHDLLGWTAPKTGANHHGRRYFLANQQRDEHNRLCTDCHGANLDGGAGTVGVSCTTCHSTWRDCTFCHGTPPNQNNPPLGIAGEVSAATLSVGDHVAHLVTQNISCPTCHAVPPANNVAHALSYVPSANLSTPGHHGDVSFAGGAGAATATVWNVNATSGNPVTARGTCTLGCHSNGKGGNPIVLPYWAGGAWTPGFSAATRPLPRADGPTERVLPSPRRGEDAMAFGRVATASAPGTTSSSPSLPSRLPHDLPARAQAFDAATVLLR
jgi:predicted CxxxxCH...CXXCH cytochrome family protein